MASSSQQTGPVGPVGEIVSSIQGPTGHTNMELAAAHGIHCTGPTGRMGEKRRELGCPLCLDDVLPGAEPLIMTTCCQKFMHTKKCFRKAMRRVRSDRCPACSASWEGLEGFNNIPFSDDESGVAAAPDDSDDGTYGNVDYCLICGDDHMWTQESIANMTDVTASMDLREPARGDDAYVIFDRRGHSYCRECMVQAAFFVTPGCVECNTSVFKINVFKPPLVVPGGVFPSARVARHPVLLPQGDLRRGCIHGFHQEH